MIPVLLLQLLACGGPEAPEASGGPATEPPQPTAPQTDTATIPVTTEGPAEVAQVDAATMRPVLTGMAALCDRDQAGDPAAAWLAAEFVGAPAALGVTPWHGDAPGTPVALPVQGDGGVFIRTEVDATVDGCADATWVWRIEAADGAERCIVTGPDAARVAQATGCRASG